MDPLNKCVVCGAKLGFGLNNHHCSPHSETKAIKANKLAEQPPEPLQTSLGARLAVGFATQSDWYYDELLADKDDKW